MARFGHDPKKIWVMTQAGAIGLGIPTLFESGKSKMADTSVLKISSLKFHLFI
jgi:hypothetical protein